MFQCGLPIPVGDRSKVGIFDDLMIDIGDEQSLENDLSTYSSHLFNMKNMIKQANARTLILIDEFGTGTEPQIGGAIAESCLKQFLNRGRGRLSPPTTRTSSILPTTTTMSPTVPCSMTAI